MIDDCIPISTPVRCEVKLSKNDEGERIYSTLFKSLVKSLRYVTYTRPDIIYVVMLISHYIETTTTTHFKVAKEILYYLKGIIDFGLFYLLE